MKKLSIFFLILLIQGCATFNDALTPKVTITKDDYHDSTIISQQAVSAAADLSESYHMLGFNWNSKYPDKIILAVGVDGVDNVTGACFKIEELEICSKSASYTNYGSQSYNYFSISLDEFKKIANADIVKMKVTRLDKYSLSSFGKKRELAIVNKKFQPFLDAIAKCRGEEPEK